MQSLQLQKPSHSSFKNAKTTCSICKMLHTMILIRYLAMYKQRSEPTWTKGESFWFYYSFEWNKAVFY